METDQQPERYARVFGSPGQSPRTLGPLRVFWPLAPICFAAGWLLHAALPKPHLSTTQAGWLLIALAVALALFAGWSARRLTSFIKGAEGEETVARILSRLPAGFSVYNDLQFDAAGPSFDHIVVAPSGLFVIETKNWSGDITFEEGQVLCNGRRPSRSPLRQVKTQAAALLDRLAAARCPQVPVTAVVCFVGGRLAGGATNIGGVRICTDADLPAVFENMLETPLPGGTLAMVRDELGRALETAQP